MLRKFVSKSNTKVSEEEQAKAIGLIELFKGEILKLKDKTMLSEAKTVFDNQFNTFLEGPYFFSYVHAKHVGNQAQNVGWLTENEEIRNKKLQEEKREEELKNREIYQSITIKKTDGTFASFTLVSKEDTLYERINGDKKEMIRIGDNTVNDRKKVLLTEYNGKIQNKEIGLEAFTVLGREKKEEKVITQVEDGENINKPQKIDEEIIEIPQDINFNHDEEIYYPEEGFIPEEAFLPNDEVVYNDNVQEQQEVNLPNEEKEIDPHENISEKTIAELISEIGDFKGDFKIASIREINKGYILGISDDSIKFWKNKPLVTIWKNSMKKTIGQTEVSVGDDITMVGSTIQKGKFINIGNLKPLKPYKGKQNSGTKGKYP